MTKRPAALRLLLLSAVLVLSACTAASGAEPGGADRLPGPVPEGAGYAIPPEDAVPAPAFELTLPDGTVVTGEQLWEERPVILHFFASWCTACQEQQAEINEVAEEQGDRIAFLGIAASDEGEAMLAYLRDHDVPYAAGLDPDLDVWLKYGVKEPPLVAVIAKGGAILRGAPGGVDGDRLRELIDEVMAD